MTLRGVADTVGLELLVKCREFLPGCTIRDELDDGRFAVVDLVATDQVAFDSIMGLAREHELYSRLFLCMSPPTISPPARLFFCETRVVRFERVDRFEIATFTVHPAAIVARAATMYFNQSIASPVSRSLYLWRLTIVRR